MLTKGNLVGGAIGFAGSPGIPGQGGKGGTGGSSYSWTESSTYRTHDGKTRTRHTRHSNSGGHTGPRGRCGLPSHYYAHDGKQGPAGKLQIHVTHADGSHTYHASPFNLELVTFDVSRENHILEPDSLISIDHITVRNSGGMPLPNNYPIRIFLEPDDWLECDGDGLQLQQALQPGESSTFTRKGIQLRIADYLVNQPRNRPFQLRHPVNPVAWRVGGVGRPFRQFENREEIEIKFPVELTLIRSLTILALGDSTILTWAITNTSEETFDQKHLYRAVNSSIRLMTQNSNTAADITHESIIFFDPDGTECNLHKSAF